MRTVTAAPITRKTHRLKLEPRKSPFYRELSDGLHIGYRRLADGTPGRWLVRERQPDGRYKERAIGVADDCAQADGVSILDYDQAVDLARPSAVKLGPPIPMLHEAIDGWLGSKTAMIASLRTLQHARWMAGHLKASFADAPIDKISATDISTWHQHGIAGDARSARASADRKLAALSAALSRAWALAGLEGPKPWTAVKSFGPKRAGSPRTVRLSPDAIRRLIDAAAPDLVSVLTLAAETGARPGELYSARVGHWASPCLDLDGKTGPRQVRVSPVARALLDRLCRGANDPKRHILLRTNGLPWRGSTGDLTKAFALARAKAGLPDDVVLYSLRHSFISDALERGAPSVMVARHCGTSVAMLEQTYAKFLPDTSDSLMGGLSGG